MSRRSLTSGDIDYVIVHKVDRLARNRADDVTINLAIRDAGATLVSVSENIDQTPSGTLLHGIVASVAEFYSRNLSLEVQKGMDQKARRGGLPGRAPLGYRNAREVLDDREIRTVEIDPTRADHIRWAFETYAKGDTTLRQLAQALDERGLRTRRTRKSPPQPLTPQKVQAMLRNSFYVGLIEWKNEQYQGSHTPLVDPETWTKVQETMTSRNRNSVRHRRLEHYLKGSLACGRCGGRLSFTRTQGRRGGEYDYFYCLARQAKTGCDLPYLPVEEVEEHVADLYTHIQLGEDIAADVQKKLLDTMRKATSNVERERRIQEGRIKELEAERRRLLQAHTQHGAIPADLLREEQTRLADELADAQARLTATNTDWDRIEINVTYALGLTIQCGQAYRRGAPRVRQKYNQAFFDAIYVNQDGTVTASLSPMFKILPPGVRTAIGDTKNPQSAGIGGLSKNDLVGVEGLEPPTSAL